MSRIPKIAFTPIDAGLPSRRMEVARALASELAIEGVDECGALPVAITILAAVQAAIDAGDTQAMIDYLREDRRQSDAWWIRQHPRTKNARVARERQRIRKGEGPA